MAIEITSPNNRPVDLSDKSIQYSNTGIPTYVIVDRTGRRVIVRTGAGQSGTHAGYKSERVFKGEQIVECRLFRDRALTPNMVLNPLQTAEEVAQSPTRRANIITALEKNKTKAAEARATTAEARAATAEASNAKLKKEIEHLRRFNK